MWHDVLIDSPRELLVFLRADCSRRAVRANRKRDVWMQTHSYVTHTRMSHVTHMYTTNMIYICVYHTCDAHMYMYITHMKYVCVRPTQSIMYVMCVPHVCPSCVSLTGNQISEKHFTYRPAQIFTIMFRRFLFSRIWSSTQDHAVLIIRLNLVGFFISTWPRWSRGHALYHSCTSF